MAYRVKDRFNIDSENRIIYDKIKKESPGLRLSNMDIFKLAMAYGYNQSIRKPLYKKEGFIRITFLNDDFNSLIWLIAIDEFGNDFHELDENLSRLYEIAEEYANAGIVMIGDRLKPDFDFYRMLEEIIFSLYDEKDLVGALENIK